MDSTTLTLRARAVHLARAGGETFDALDFDRRCWWEAVAVECGRMIEVAVDNVLRDAAEDPVEVSQRLAMREAVRANAAGPRMSVPT